MDRRLGVVTAAALVLNVGCTMFQGHGVIDAHLFSTADRQIQLTQNYRCDALRTGPAHNYGQLVLTVKQGDRIVLSRVVGRREGHFKEHPHFRLNIEARTDTTGQRVWLVARDARHVIASVDLTTNAVTGYDDTPPSWAKVDEGRIIEGRVR